MLIANAMNTKNSAPAENFDSRAQPSQSPKNMMRLRLGSCHMRAKDQSVPSENRAIDASVMTSGPNVRKSGLLTKTVSERRPPQSPPS